MPPSGNNHSKITDGVLVLDFALSTFLFLPLYRIQFLNIINSVTNPIITQNLNIVIVAIFIWLAKAKENAPKAR